MAPSFRTSIPRLGRVRLKENPIGDMLVPMGPGAAVWTPRRYDRLADEGYMLNVVAYQCVQMTASAIAGLVLEVRRDDKALDTHPLYDLLAQPNPMNPGAQFMEHLTADHRIAGNVYIHGGRPSRRAPPRELWILRPDRMKIIPAANGMPQAYEYEVNGIKRRFDCDPLTGRGEVLHIKTYHPLDDWYGMSPIEAAARSIDQDNAATEWNAALMQNSAKPSGAFMAKSAITQENVKIAQAALMSWYTGATKAGLPLVMGNEWTWQEMSINPKDMDFYEGLQHNARRICAAFNVPHHLVVPGESTYNNRRDAHEEFYENCVLPLADRLLDALGGWLSWMYDEAITIHYDDDMIPALAGKRELIRQGARADWRDGLITHGEAREALGFAIDPGKADAYRTDMMGLGLGGIGSDGLPKPPKLLPPPPQDEPGDEEPKAAGYDSPPVLKALPGPSGGDLTLKKGTLAEQIVAAVEDGVMIDLMRPTIQEAIWSFGQLELERLGLGVRFDLFDPRVVEYLETWGAEKVTGMITQTTKRAIGNTLAQARAAGESQIQQVRRILDVFDDASARRARVIAKTESVAASNFGAVTAIQQVGLMKQWISTVGDDRTRGTSPKDKADHVKMNLQLKKADEDFVDPRNGDRMQHPGGGSTAASNVNCRCFVAAYDPEEEPDQQASPVEIETKAGMLWKLRDGQRAPFEQVIEDACRQGFNLQLEAVLRAWRVATA